MDIKKTKLVIKEEKALKIGDCIYTACSLAGGGVGALVGSIGGILLTRDAVGLLLGIYGGGLCGGFLGDKVGHKIAEKVENYLIDEL